MSKTKEVKTNAMRMLERMKIPYEAHTYECEEFVDGIQVADMLHLPHEKVYKTLVTVGNSKNYFVFVLPIEAEVHVKDINSITGYVRGGCTAIGMKKQFVTRIAAAAENLDKIIVSGGRIGSQLELKPEDLKKACKGEFADITV